VDITLELTPLVIYVSTTETLCPVPAPACGTRFPHLITRISVTGRAVPQPHHPSALTLTLELNNQRPQPNTFFVPQKCIKIKIFSFRRTDRPTRLRVSNAATSPASFQIRFARIRKLTNRLEAMLGPRFTSLDCIR